MYRHKILVVDDTDEWREVSTLWLRKERYRVRGAPDGSRAIALAERFRPDCIVLDFHLGDQTALEVCDALRERPHLAPIPIVVLTFDEQEKLRAYSKCKVDHFVLKSAGQEELVAVIAAVLRRLDWDAGILKRGDLALLPKSLAVQKSGRVITRLSPEQFSLLYLLVQRSPDFVGGEEICKVVLHKRLSLGKSDAIRSLAHRLRSVLGTQLARRIKNSKRLGWVYLDGLTVRSQVNATAKAASKS